MRGFKHVSVTISGYRNYELICASNFYTRLVGLMFQPVTANAKPLWLRNCTSIHTCFMRYNLDLYFLDSKNQVISSRMNVVPFRFVLSPPDTKSIIECAAGTSAIFAEGSLLTFKTSENDHE